MLKRYKNALFVAIEKSGYSLSDFQGEDGPTSAHGFTIRYRPADLTFTVTLSDDDPHEFEYSYLRYTGDEPIDAGPFPENEYATFDQVLEGLNAWLRHEVPLANEEQLLPDLWSQAAATGMLTHNTGEQYFSAEEKRQAKLAIKTFRILLENEFDPSVDQLEVIADQLDYLSNAVDRLNRFDWKGVAISTLLGIATTLSLDTERGRQLYGLFQEAFIGLMHLLR